MKIPFKVIGLSVLSLSLLASGCGDKGTGHFRHGQRG